MKTAIIYFSPTKSGERIAVRLKSLLNCKMIDITLPNHRLNTKIVEEVELLYVITPVYGQNIPQLLREYFEKIIFHGKLVLISVYGGVKVGGALKQVRNCFTKPVIAAALFIGTHSYNDQTIKLGINRPNETDLNKLNELIGLVEVRLKQNITVKLHGHSNPFALLLPKIILNLSSKVPVVKQDCNQCMVCHINCPTGAINPDLSINRKLCCHCYRCTMLCPDDNRPKRISFITRRYLIKHGKKMKEVIII